MRILGIVALGAALGGCAAIYAKQDDAFCAASGSPAGSQHYQQCRANVAQSHPDYQMDPETRQALLLTGLTLLAQRPTPPPVPEPQLNLFCRPDGRGNFNCQ
jgi:hypothetical protein